MRRHTAVLLRMYAPDGVYPYRQPFYDTPYDEDRNPRDVNNAGAVPPYPRWMDHGIDGTGYGAGLHRAHPLSKLNDNMQRDYASIPRIFGAMTMGINAKNGQMMYYRGGKPPNPSRHPYLTGEPCPVYGWRVTDHAVTRTFEMPVVDKEKQKYKPYCAMQDHRLLQAAAAAGSDGPAPAKAKDAPAAAGAPPPAAKDKPMDQLKKRLFFWR